MTPQDYARDMVIKLGKIDPSRVDEIGTMLISSCQDLFDQISIAKEDNAKLEQEIKNQKKQLQSLRVERKKRRKDLEDRIMNGIIDWAALRGKQNDMTEVTRAGDLAHVLMSIVNG